MTYAAIIEDLYSNDLLKIIRVLNNSKYALNINKAESGIFVIHTGFIFKTHKKNLMEILYDFNSESVIRQPKNENYPTNVPAINGLWLKGEENYFSLFYPVIYPEINEEENFPGFKDEDNQTLCRYELVNPHQYLQAHKVTNVEVKALDKKFLSSIKVVKEKEIREYPFQKRFEQEIFFDGNVFKKNISDE